MEKLSLAAEDDKDGIIGGIPLLFDTAGAGDGTDVTVMVNGFCAGP